MTLETFYQLYLQHPQITTDSRNCPLNSIFFALKGENFNGNKYAASALEKGCAYAVVDEKEYATDERFILVDDCLKTLQNLAHHHRIALGLPVLGITGTNGKTTTKELIANVLGRRYKVLFTQGNLNNHIGVPLTLLSLATEHQLAVVEMGANHPGEIKELVEIAAPNAGLITNVGKAHLEGFGSFEGVIKTKSELYDFLRETEGTAFVNADNSILTEKSEGINRIFYGMGNDVSVKGSVTGNSPFLEMQWQQAGSDEIHYLKTQLIGSYNAENVLAAVCIGVFFSIAPADICAAINSYAPQNNRSQFKQTAHNKLIIDAYNANPTSMKAAIENFVAMESENKMLILGDMRELGADSQSEHQAIVDLLSQQKDFKQVFLLGECFSATQSSFPTFPDTEKFTEYLSENKIENSIILIKGSRGMKLETLIDSL